MAVFASQEWFDELCASASATSLKIDHPVVVQQIITDPSPDEIGSWFLEISDRVAVSLGRAALPTITLISDRETGEAFSRGHLNAQTAISTGRLRVTGDIGALVVAAPLLLELATFNSR